MSNHKSINHFLFGKHFSRETLVWAKEAEDLRKQIHLHKKEWEEFKRKNNLD